VFPFRFFAHYLIEILIEYESDEPGLPNSTDAGHATPCKETTKAEF
jgi:hypothetical protein